MKQPSSRRQTPWPDLATLIRDKGHQYKDVASVLGIDLSRVSRLCSGDAILDVRHVEPLAKYLGESIATVVRAAVASAPYRHVPGESDPNQERDHGPQTES